MTQGDWLPDGWEFGLREESGGSVSWVLLNGEILEAAGRAPDRGTAEASARLAVESWARLWVRAPGRGLPEA